MVQAYHPLDHFLPPLRGGARPGNARQVALLVLLVACDALRDHQFVRDWDAVFRLLRRSAAASATATRPSLAEHQGRYKNEYEQVARHADSSKISQSRAREEPHGHAR